MHHRFEAGRGGMVPSFLFFLWQSLVGFGIYFFHPACLYFTCRMKSNFLFLFDIS